jgi:hypothetical protein
MGLLIVDAKKSGLLEPLFRFRLEVFQSIGIDLDPLTFNGGMFKDEYDDVAVNYAVVLNGEVKGSFRVIDLERVNNPAPLIDRFELNRFVDQFGLAATTVVGRMALADEIRRGSVMISLLIRAINERRERGGRIAVWDSSPSLQSMYERLGFYPYGRMFQDPIFGPKIRVACLLGDTVSGNSRSPIAEAAKALGDDAEVRDWFCAEYANDIARLTVRKVRGDWVSYCRQSLVPGVSFWSELTPESITALTLEAALLEVVPGDVLRAASVPEHALFIGMRGSYRIGPTAHQVVGPGHPLWIPRLFDDRYANTEVVALTEGEILIVPESALLNIKLRRPTEFLEIAHLLSAPDCRTLADEPCTSL